ncbi:MAG: N-6 DNA methylase [Acidimicrobiales bacterium]
MTRGAVDLAALLRRMAGSARTEATLQSEIHTFLLAGDLNLDDEDVANATLESPTAGRRIDVEVGHACIEVKKELRPGASLDRAVEQLGAYVLERTESLGQRFTGILTDGQLWQLYHLAPEGMVLVSMHRVDPIRPDVQAFTSWLAGVLATEEQLVPTAGNIESRLGALSSGHQLEQADLRALYEANRDRPELVVKRELWARLLRTALGTDFDADDHELFVEHTLLVASAETIAHAALGFVVAGMDPAALLGGDLFTRRAQILGVVEHDFFDWPLNCGEPGRRWVSGLARRLAQFDWSATEHDAMKTIYESVITAETRRRLGEYYTPDWLAEHMVRVTIAEPLTTRVVDPSCGSGTFLFHAVRHYLAAAEAAGHDNGEALTGLVGHVAGLDLHPVAATLARVTYLLAIGPGRLQQDRPPLRIPVYLGDSLQWGQRRDLFSSETLNVDTDDGLQLFADQLRFPDRLLDDADRFDQLVAELADAASGREQGSAHPDVAAIARRHALAGGDLEIVAETFERMCRLHDEGRNHIWGYFVRNIARPAWLARPANRVDVLIGNPPWLVYRSMTEAMQERFKEMTTLRQPLGGRLGGDATGPLRPLRGAHDRAVPRRGWPLQLRDACRCAHPRAIRGLPRGGVAHRDA